MYVYKLNQTCCGRGCPIAWWNLYELRVLKSDHFIRQERHF